MKVAFLILILTVTSHAQFLQAIPSKTANNCDIRADKMEKWLLDWPDLTRYRQANAANAATKAAGRVVFMGDSITDMWDLRRYFPGRPYINRGISGQTTAQMLLRFQQDVVNLHPEAVVLLAGTNDIAGNTGPVSLNEIENNIRAMAAIAQANNIKVIISSITPVHNYTERSTRLFDERPVEKIRALNAWLKEFAAGNRYAYVDYYSAMTDRDGLLKRELAEDGLHPNEAGYKLMVSLICPAIEKTLGK